MKLNCIAVFLLFFMSSLFITSQNKDVYGKINMLKKDKFIILKAQIENDGLIIRDELEYIFIALKKNESGNYSNNKQSGKFSISPREEKEVSVIRINIGREDELKAYLFIKHKNKLLSKDSLFILPKNKNRAQTRNMKEKNFSLKGIVVNEAITKIGKDFQDYFYQNYLLSGRKYPFIIKIKEKPGMGRSSIISVEAEDRKIFEFFSKPDEEYLKTNVNVALQRIHLYAKQRSNLLKASKI